MEVSEIGQDSNRMENYDQRISIESISILNSFKAMDRDVQLFKNSNSQENQESNGSPKPKQKVTFQVLVDRFKTRVQRKAFKKMKDQGLKRIYYFEQLIEKEGNYIKDLENIIDDLKKPLQQENILTLQEINSLFSNIEDIKEVNKGFYSKLLEVQNDKTENYFYKRISTRILDYIPKFSIYIENIKAVTIIQNKNTLFKLIQEKQQFQEYILSFIQRKVKMKPLDNREQNEDLVKTVNIVLQRQLKRPFGRIFGYRLTLNEILKSMSEDHCDREGVKNVINKFHQITVEINNLIEKAEGDEKLKQLQINFGKDDLNIFDTNRTFEWEKNLQFLKKEHRQLNMKLNQNQQERVCLCQVFFMNDLVVVAQSLDKNQDKESEGLGQDQEPQFVYLDHIFLDEFSFVKDLKNTKHLQNLVGLVGSDHMLTFIMDSEAQKFNLIQKMRKLANRLRESKGKEGEIIIIEVNTIGSMEQNQNSLQQETEYIIEVSYEDWFSKKINLTFDKFKQYHSQIQTGFPEIKIDAESNSIWLNQFKTKVIEDRQLLIENYLQTLLKNQVFLNSPQSPSYLVQLGLPENLITMIQNRYVQLKNNSLIHECEPYQDEQEDEESKDRVSGNPNYNLENFNFRETGQRGTSLEYKKVSQSEGQIELGARISDQNPGPLQKVESLKIYDRNSYINSRISIQSQQVHCVSEILNQNPILQKKAEMQMFKEKQQVMPYFSIVECEDQTEIIINYSQTTTAYDVCQYIARIINLDYFLDFRLFVKLEDESEQVLYEDTVLYSKIPRDEKKSVFDKIGFLRKKPNHQIHFQKYIWLFQPMEAKQYLRDTVRLKLVYAQIMNEITQYRIVFDEVQHYFYFLAIYFFVQKAAFIENKKVKTKKDEEDYQNQLCDLFKQVLPDIIYNSVSFENIESNFQNSYKNLQKLFEKDYEDHQQQKSFADYESPDVISNYNQDISDNSNPTNRTTLDVERSKAILSSRISQNKNFAQQVFARLYILDMIQNHPHFGTRHFYVHTHKQTVQSFYSKKQKTLPNNVNLSISIHGLQIMGPLKKEQIFQIQYDEIKRIDIQPRGIIFVLQEQQELILQFETYCGFEIDQIIKEYSQILNDYDQSQSPQQKNNVK